MIGMPVSLALMIVGLMTQEPDKETQDMVEEIRYPGGKVYSDR